jgi:hypothetical protein
MKKAGLIFLFLGTLIIPSEGQKNAVPVPGDLYLGFTNINFIKDDEYSNPVIEGYTLIGYFLQPQLVYAPTTKVTLRAGANLLSYSGTNKFTRVKPVFSTTYNFAKYGSVTLGSLAGSDSHRMFDPHFNKERLYTDWSEDGIQVGLGSEHFFSDTWVSWENFIFRGDNHREIFTSGESFSYSSGTIAGLFRLEIPIQLQFKHYGGQISNYPQQVETYFNTAAGIKLVTASTGNDISHLGLECLLFNGKNLTRNAPSGINSGHGEWYKIFFNWKFAGVEAGYWNSHDFYAPNGDFIFGSVSDHLTNVVIPDRRILTCSANLNFLPESFLEFYFGFDGYYDTDLRIFDYALTLHLRFDKLFRIMAIK